MLQPIHDMFQDSVDENMLVGLRESDDAAVYEVADGMSVIQTVDFFPPIVDDPWTYGAISAANAMSDVYAMGGDVKFGLNIVGWPEDLDTTYLQEVLRGGAEKLLEAGALVAGGHTVKSQEPLFGLSVSGLVQSEKLVRTSGAQLNDLLVITKPIGTGVALTACKGDAELAASLLPAVIQSMLVLNQKGSEIGLRCNVSAMTDVTGFGLVGHAAEMADQSNVTLIIRSGSVPLFADVIDLVDNSGLSGGLDSNKASLMKKIGNPDTLSSNLLDLFFDPQTSGPLLLSLAPPDATEFCSEMESLGQQCWIIGEVTEFSGSSILFD